ncbi:MAG: hypothetical protein MZV70_19440 [Desulfobacterales bacterium]|nr:hypothetical protein [Desulfobacterales bacterium]
METSFTTKDTEPTGAVRRRPEGRGRIGGERLASADIGEGGVGAAARRPRRC